MKTPEALQRAIDSYNEAIALGKELPLDVHEYRNDLAAAFMNRGNVYKEMKTPEALQRAIDSYGEAIALSKELPLDVDEYRNDLASAYYSRGNAYHRLESTAALRRAIDSYDEALKLASKLSLTVLDHANLKALTLFNKAHALLDINTREAIEEATDCMDESLALLRELEVAGILSLRPTREETFKLAILAYGWQQQFLPEIILENLDPANHGAAPESESMHDVAQRELTKILVNSREPELKLVAQEALNRLLYIRTLYFAGTARSARLRAGFHLAAGDPEAAENVLMQHLEHRPEDPEGHLVLAEFYSARERVEQSIEAFEKAADQMVAAAPPSLTADGFEASALGGRLGKIASASSRLLFGGWPEVVAEALGTEIETIKVDIQKERLDWLNLYDAAIAESAAERERQTLDSWCAEWKAQANARAEILYRTLLQGISVAWGHCAKEVISRASVLLDAFTPEMEANQDEEVAAELEQELAEAVARTVREATRKLAASEVDQVAERVHEVLDGVSGALSLEEVKHLATGLRFLEEEGMERFAGVAFGLAVELSFPPHLMLGELVGSFNRAVHRCPLSEKATAVLIRDYLSGFSGKSILLDVEPEAKKYRKKALDHINAMRIRCAHPKDTPSAEDLRQVWNEVASHRENAFFRYFAGAFLPPE
jgi:tetratricopeptide (TPR) repeat protein